MTDLVVHPMARPLTGSVPVPADKSIAHRALLLAAIASGESAIHGAVFGEDNQRTLAALRAMGVVFGEGEVLRVAGKGLHGLSAPLGDIDCGNSGTTMRLLAGVLAPQRFATRLVGDASLSRRPMERVARPLRLRGARIEGRLDPGRPGEITAPLEIGPLPAPAVLSGLEYEVPVASAQVKSAILLSGLWADGPTRLREPVVSRDHTERMLIALGVPLRTIGGMVELDGPGWGGELPSFEMRVPGDLSAAAFVIAAAVIVEGSRVEVRDVGLNPTRTGLLEILRDMGAQLAVTTRSDALGEPVGLVEAASGPLGAVTVGGEVVTRAIDEVPVVCALAARARGTTRVRGAEELRVKESDRIATMIEVLRAFGVSCTEQPGGLDIEGVPGRALTAAEVQSRGDHRIAMTAAVLALAADGPTRVRDADCIATSFPRFAGTMRALGARVEVA